MVTTRNAPTQPLHALPGNAALRHVEGYRMKRAMRWVVGALGQVAVQVLVRVLVDLVERLLGH